jgi:hypothetical protein
MGRPMSRGSRDMGTTNLDVVGSWGYRFSWKLPSGDGYPTLPHFRMFGTSRASGPELLR